MSKHLPPAFFNSPTEKVAKNLLGQILVRSHRGKILKGVITEVEIYDGFEDKASHASRGQTPRNAPMFGPPGHWYIYLVYGMYWMLNIVTREKGYPAAILIRGTERHRGPGKVTRHFHINKTLNGTLAHPDSGVWIERNPEKIIGKVKKGARIGIDYAGPYWTRRAWRYSLILRPNGGEVQATQNKKKSRNNKGRSKSLNQKS